MAQAPPIGIDLGTSYSCVAVWRDDKVEIIPNDQGNRTTPSCVAFSDTERLIGDSAKNQIAMNPQNTVNNAKRLIGRCYNDPKIRADLKNWPFKVVSDCGKPNIQVRFKGETKNFTPEEISSMVIIKMKETAEAFLGSNVTDAVISVPAHFNNSQRQATKDAGEIAGLNVLRIINEPSAAALAYGLNKNLKGERNVLIFDLGGGTFDVSIVTIHEGTLFEVQATAGDTHLGGEDFDNRLVNYLTEEFQRKFHKDIRRNSRALCRLQNAAEKAKRTLSSSIEASIEIDALLDGLDFYTKVSRARFERLCYNIFWSTLDSVKKALADADITKNYVHDVVLVGGSTRIPYIQFLLRNFFRKPLINYNEAVVYGAAIQAAIVSVNASPAFQDVLLLDTVSLSLGIETACGDFMTKVVERGATLPHRAVSTITTNSNNQPAITIDVYESEAARTDKNELLGTFEVTDIPPAPQGVPQIHIIFDLDANGILKVCAEDSTGESKNVVIKNDKCRLSQEKISHMVDTAEKNKEEDKKHQKKIAARNELESFAFNIQREVDYARNKLMMVHNECQAALSWLDNNTLADAEEVKIKSKELRKKCEGMPAHWGHGPSIEEMD